MVEQTDDVEETLSIRTEISFLAYFCLEVTGIIFLFLFLQQFFFAFKTKVMGSLL